MNNSKIRLLLIAALIIPTIVSAAGKHALLIAIQDYSNTPFSSLKGPANDIKLTEDVLRKRFGFQDNDFIIIKDAQATHTGIENAFKALIERVKSDDFVYIYYSGHGSQIDDSNGDETSGFDQTWVSYGARTSNEAHKDNYDVLDDEINAWLVELYAKTEQVVFVSDSCHSATVSRAVSQGEILVRAIEKDKRPHLLGKRPYKQLKTHRGIRVGAARDDESAKDGLKKMDRFYGFFTWYWVENLEKAQAGETWNDVFKRTYAQVFKRDYTQVAQNHAPQPQIEGEHHQQVLGGGFTPLPLRIPVLITSRGSKIRVGIEAGELAGVTKGSKYCLYKPEESNPPKPLCLTIGKVTPFVSYDAEKFRTSGTFHKGDLVVEKSHAYHFTPIKVYLEADFPKEDEPLLKDIRAAFQPNLSSADGTQPLSAYQLTNDPRETDIRLYLLRPKLQDGQLIPASPGNILPKSFPNQPPELWILTPEQRLLKKDFKIPFTDLKKGIELLQDNLKKIARVREVKALQSPRSSTLPVIVQNELFSPVSSCPKGANCVQSPEGLTYQITGPYHLQEIDELILSQGDILFFSLHNQSERKNYYCYLINITHDGAIRAIFPASGEHMEVARINKGKTRKTNQGLWLKQVGEETLKLIISEHPIDISLLEQPPITREELNPLEQLLVNATHGLRNEPSIDIDEWATGQVTFEVGAIKDE